MKILAIAPYEGLKEIMLAMGKAENFELQVEIGDLKQGVALSKEALLNGTDIIISRGGTAAMIQKEISLPVVEIEVSGYDMLRVLTFVKDYPGKTAIVGFSQISEGAATICEILNIEISSYTINSEGEVKPKLEALKKEGYQVIIGDVITVSEAEKLGLNGFLLTSGEESVGKAFSSAKKLYSYINKVKQQYTIPYHLIKEEEKGIVVLSEKKSKLFSNKYFDSKIGEDLLKKEEFNVAFENTHKTGSYSSIIEDQGFFWEITGDQLSIDSSKMITFKLTQSPFNQSSLPSGLSIVSYNQAISKAIKVFLLTDNDKLKKTIESALAYRSKIENIWISGEKGTGKESLAYFIHFHDTTTSEPLLVLNCELIEDDSWVSLVNKSGSEKNKTTVLLKNIEAMPLQLQKKLMNQLKTNSLHANFIVTSNGDIHKYVRDHKILLDLYDELAKLTIELPLLNERIEDIEIISRLFIHDFNTLYGKQIVGIRKNSIDILQQFNWRGNINQLKQVIGKCVLLAKQPYIEKELIQHVLDSEQINSGNEEIDLSGTLEEIENRIIQKVWLEEGMNQTKTAKRLGINRTTLWRKLKV
ncbi:sigma-54-dependent Fis family transcriptional regulator [Metabacillus arenae]|uniref:Sigma-54-dependent Fis family transcriptional regulator n=1 Tax=Metabacillus arenae TaxID=2771434 RepID=A0A926RZV5_9BACI|nr:sigma-54-dependent transcriptional regulator [Metabacillus arenae]MBD1382637.1 sigma-54-dependent Fis family transcriptional regulator [Metabacillus arenae]